MSQEHSIINIMPSSSPECGQSEWIKNSLAIDLGLSQLQAIGDLMSVCSGDGVEDGAMLRLGQLIRDKAQEIKALWEEEQTFLMSRRVRVQ
jgi:hypothetical protein